MTMSATTDLKKTPLFDWHATHGAKLADFAGWSMPIQYTSIVQEHLATRGGASIFDVSHMARLEFSGPDAGRFVDHLLSRRVDNMKVGRIRYSLIVNEQGGVLDDVLVYRLSDVEGHANYWMVVNAGNHQKILAWIGDRLPEFKECQFTDHTLSTAMIAVQGPQAVALLKEQLDAPVDQIKYYHAKQFSFGGQPALVSRTGYTGEDGCELITTANMAVRFWTNMIDAHPDKIVAAGLAARDTLRLEAGMPLYGHELSEDINPWQADLGFAVNLKNRDFIGRDALQHQRDAEQESCRVGFALDGRRVPRIDYKIVVDDKPIGVVTSGTFSPTLERPIGMGYVQPRFAEPGTKVDIDIRGRLEEAEVVPLPFYERRP